MCIYKMKSILMVNYFLFLLFAVVYAQSINEQDYYIGAVVEYAPSYNALLSPAQNILKNADEYVKQIQIAKERGADIIVFPEDGLTTINLDQNVLLFAKSIPDPNDKVVPCNKTELNIVLQRFSCTAQSSKIYIVVNLVEKFGPKDEIFNTNIVFDRTGALIAKYRKFNLFNEFNFTKPSTPELVSFTTDFGVTFGVFTCFDILFAKPSLELLKQNPSVTDIVFPTAWFSELPYLTALQTQAGWARANGVNLLAAGYNKAEEFLGGSGIFPANGNITISYPNSNQTTLIISAVKKIKQRVSSETVDSRTAKITSVHSFGINTFKEDLSNYTTVSLNGTSVDNYKLCHEKFCCNFSVQIAQNVQSYYRFLVYSGPRKFTGIEKVVELCGLTSCQNNSIESCGLKPEKPKTSTVFNKISITGTFSSTGSVTFPSTVFNNLSILTPSSFIYKTNDADCQKKVVLETTESINDLLSFGVYSVFSECEDTSSSNTVIIIVVCVIIVVIIAVISVLFARHQLKKNRLKDYY